MEGKTNRTRRTLAYCIAVGDRVLYSRVVIVFDSIDWSATRARAAALWYRGSSERKRGKAREGVYLGDNLRSYLSAIWFISYESWRFASSSSWILKTAEDRWVLRSVVRAPKERVTLIYLLYLKFECSDNLRKRAIQMPNSTVASAAVYISP